MGREFDWYCMWIFLRLHAKKPRYDIYAYNVIDYFLLLSGNFILAFTGLSAGESKLGALKFKIGFIDHNEILHTSRQFHCRDVCKISLWSVENVSDQITAKFCGISTSIETSLVGRAPADTKRIAHFSVLVRMIRYSYCVNKNITSINHNLLIRFWHEILYSLQKWCIHTHDRPHHAIS